MRLMEYEAKRLFKAYNIPVPEGWLLRPNEAVHIDRPSVLKAQVHAGGRGKAGGIVFVSSSTEAAKEAGRLFGALLCGHRVEEILVEDMVQVEREFFMGVTYDTSTRGPVVIFCTEGGVDIEELARSSPEKIIKEPFTITKGFHGFHARNILLQAGLKGKILLKAADLLCRLVALFLEMDATLVEINPLVLTPNADLFACDARVEIEDEALYRQEARLDRYGISRRRETEQQSPFEREAARIDGLDHRGVAGRMIEFDGDLGLIVGGGGASLTAFDAVRRSGGSPANYCEIGGNPSVLKVKELTKLILSKPGVRKLAVIMNVVSNTRVDLMARGVIKGILEAGREPSETVAVFRVPGAWEEEGFKILAKYNVPYCDRRVSIDEAAEMAVASMKRSP